MRYFFLTLLSLALLASDASADLIFHDSFAGFSDGQLNGQGNWGAQTNWTVSSGKATVPGTAFARAQRFGGFRVEDGEQVRITLFDLVVTGAGSNQNLFAFGFAKSNEHTGAQTPQVRAEMQFDGSSLSIGGATDTGYDSGDSIDLTLTFLRNGSDWSLDTVIKNNTDATEFSGMDGSPTNLVGSITPQTVVQWLDDDATDKLLYGMRELGDRGQTLSLGGVKLETLKAPSVPEPTTAIIWSILVGMGLSARRRR